MRYFLISLAAFLLLAMPTWAIETQDVTVTITITGMTNLCLNSDGQIDFTIDDGEYAAGWVKPDSDDTTQVTVTSNQTYNMKIQHDNPSWWSTIGTWHLWANEGTTITGGDPPTGYYEVTASSGDYWTAEEPCTNGQAYTFYYLLSGFTYADDQVGAQGLTLTYTVMGT